jgi:hypothetical protein
VKAALDEAGVEMPEPTYRIVQRTAPDSGTTDETTGRPSSVRDQARAVDVERDGRMEAQVDEEASRSDEPNFLSE